MPDTFALLPSAGSAEQKDGNWSADHPWRHPQPQSDCMSRLQTAATFDKNQLRSLKLTSCRHCQSNNTPRTKAFLSLSLDLCSSMLINPPRLLIHSLKSQVSYKLGQSLRRVGALPHKVWEEFPHNQWFPIPHWTQSEALSLGRERKSPPNTCHGKAGPTHHNLMLSKKKNTKGPFIYFWGYIYGKNAISNLKIFLFLGSIDHDCWHCRQFRIDRMKGKKVLTDDCRWEPGSPGRLPFQAAACSSSARNPHSFSGMKSPFGAIWCLAIILLCIS